MISNSQKIPLRSIMRKHQHRWSKTHADSFCHFNTHFYVCRCGAGAVAIIEHKPDEEDIEGCSRCKALADGAVRRRSIRVTAVNGKIEQDIDEPIPPRPSNSVDADRSRP